MEYETGLPIGHRVEEYEIVQVLGAGGFGITYLGQDHHLVKPVAIKEYLPSELAVRKGNTSVVARSTGDQADFDWGLERFLEEARVLARFDHPNLPKVHRFFEAHGTAYIVMEYIEGTPLDRIYAREGVLTEEALRSIILPLLDGLEQVHEAGYLHRDIKPGNIVIRNDGDPVLLDFGAARAALGGRSRSVTSIVTPGYAPLEQYSTRGEQGPWTDLYALGAVVYRGLTGATPWDVTDRIRNDPLEPATVRCLGKASTRFLQAVDWALELDQDKRPRTLQSWREAITPQVTTTERLTEAPPVNRRDKYRLWPAVTVVALLGLAGLGVWQLEPGPAGAPASVDILNKENVVGSSDSNVPKALVSEQSMDKKGEKSAVNVSVLPKGRNLLSKLDPDGTLYKATEVDERAEKEETSTTVATIEGDAAITKDGKLKVNNRFVNLHGVEVVDKSFVDETKNFIGEQGGSLKCETKRDSYYICKTETGVDLAAAILLNGAARASGDADERYLSYEKQARTSKRGVWRE